MCQSLDLFKVYRKLSRQIIAENFIPFFMYLAVFMIYKPQKIFNIPLYKFRMPADCIGYIFLFFTRWHETTIFWAWKAKKPSFSPFHYFIHFLPFFSYTNTETLHTITETLILSRKLPACFRDNTDSFRVRIRVLPASIDFCVIVWSFA